MSQQQHCPLFSLRLPASIATPLPARQPKQNLLTLTLPHAIRSWRQMRRICLRFQLSSWRLSLCLTPRWRLCPAMCWIHCNFCMRGWGAPGLDFSGGYGRGCLLIVCGLRGGWTMGRLSWRSLSLGFCPSSPTLVVRGRGWWWLLLRRLSSVNKI